MTSPPSPAARSALPAGAAPLAQPPLPAASRRRALPAGALRAPLPYLLVALLLWTVVFPNIAVIAGSFEHGLQYWRDFVASPADVEALRTTIIIAVGSVIASAIVGIPLAFLLTRYEFRGRRLLGAIATLPAALPPLVGVIAFLFLYGESGVVSRTIQVVFHLQESWPQLRGMSGILVVHAYTMYAYFYMFTSAGLERLDAS
ncbi:MAG: ABC transporter permease, partial [Gemmatimonadaceae bacterium]